MPDPAPCSCPEPTDWCQRLRRPMPGEMHAHCRANPAVRALLEAAAKPVQAEGNKVPRQRPCRHLGGPTGEVEGCENCPGNVRLKVFACGHPAHGRTTLPACQGCADYAG